jgi:hypothetical protein
MAPMTAAMTNIMGSIHHQAAPSPQSIIARSLGKRPRHPGIISLSIKDGQGRSSLRPSELPPS